MLAKILFKIETRQECLQSEIMAYRKDFKEKAKFRIFADHKAILIGLRRAWVELDIIKNKIRVLFEKGE